VKVFENFIIDNQLVMRIYLIEFNKTQVWELRIKPHTVN